MTVRKGRLICIKLLFCGLIVHNVQTESALIEINQNRVNSFFMPSEGTEQQMRFKVMMLAIEREEKILGFFFKLI